jgi:predicted phosphodiesterase
MKTLIIPDLHLDHSVGNLHTIDFFMKYRDKLIEDAQETDFVIMLGDYFRNHDTHNRYRKILSKFIVDIDKPIIALLGQHDKDSLGHVLQAIEPLCKNLHIVEDTYEYKNCSFISHDRNDERLKQKILDSKGKFIFGHFNINGYNTGRKQMDSSLNIEIDKKFYLGDIHKHQINKNITYVGSIAPTNIGEVDYDFQYLILDIDTGKEKWFKLNYNIKTLELTEKNIDDINEGTRVIVNIDNIKQKSEWLAKLQDKKYLSLEFILTLDRIKARKIDFKMKFDTVIEEYLKMMKKERLLEKVKYYIESCK